MEPRLSPLDADIPPSAVRGWRDVRDVPPQRYGGEISSLEIGGGKEPPSAVTCPRLAAMSRIGPHGGRGWEGMGGDGRG